MLILQNDWVQQRSANNLSNGRLPQSSKNKPEIAAKQRVSMRNDRRILHWRNPRSVRIHKDCTAMIMAGLTAASSWRTAEQWRIGLALPERSLPVSKSARALPC
jgi:hypothetical protein